MEKWKDIKGFEGYYMISNKGRVKSLEKKVFFTHAVTKERHLKINKEKILKNRNSKGYYFVTLFRENYSKSFRICRLVAIHFINNPCDKPCVNHIDGDKLNDNVINLEWCTYKENMKHAKDMGLTNILKGIEHKGRKEVVCKYTGKEFINIQDAAKFANVSPSHLSRMLRGIYKNKTTLVYAKM
jgi:hypothetical protein